MSNELGELDYDLEGTGPITTTTLPDAKWKRVGNVELTFNEETEKHFLSLAPSADTMAEGAFPLSGKAPSY